MKTPLVAQFYNRYLDDGKVADFLRDVARHYQTATLARLSRSGHRVTRRAAVMALALLGQRESIPVLAESLRDRDRGVRMIAEDGLATLWQQSTLQVHRHDMQRLSRYNLSSRFRDAIRLADVLLSVDRTNGEVWFQRGAALAGESRWSEAIVSFRRAIDCEPCHFSAAFSLAQCQLELDDLVSAVGSLEATLRMHPYCDAARSQLRRLRRALRESTDC